MQLRTFALATLVAGFAAPAEAGICTLTLGLGGTLALSADGTRFGSQELDTRKNRVDEPGDAVIWG